MIGAAHFSFLGMLSKIFMPELFVDKDFSITVIIGIILMVIGVINMGVRLIVKKTKRMKVLT